MDALDAERALRRLQVGVKVISLDEMWTYVGVRRGDACNSRWIWTAVAEYALGERWKAFEWGTGASPHSCACWIGFQTRLVRVATHTGVWLLAGEQAHRVGKSGAVNRNEELHSALRGKLNGLARRTKGYSKTDETLTLSLALAWLKLGLDLANMHVLGIPAQYGYCLANNLVLYFVRMPN